MDVLQIQFYNSVRIVVKLCECSPTVEGMDSPKPPLRSPALFQFVYNPFFTINVIGSTDSSVGIASDSTLIRGTVWS